MNTEKRPFKRPSRRETGLPLHINRWCENLKLRDPNYPFTYDHFDYWMWMKEAGQKISTAAVMLTFQASFPTIKEWMLQWREENGLIKV